MSYRTTQWLVRYDIYVSQYFHKMRHTRITFLIYALNFSAVVSAMEVVMKPAGNNLSIQQSV